MMLSESEISDIEKAAGKNAAVAKLYDWYMESQTDVEELYKSAHKMAIKYISDGVRDRTLNLKEDYDAAVMEFLVKGKPIREGMQAQLSASDNGDAHAPIKNEGQIAVRRPGKP